MTRPPGRRARLIAVLAAPMLVPASATLAAHASPVSQLPPASVVRADPGWGLDRIDQRSLPLDGRYRARSQGRGVTIYVIDCGMQTANPQFGGRASRGPNIVGGRWRDCFDEMAVGHATFVGGIAAGTATGVAPRARLVSVRAIVGGEGAQVPPPAQQVRWIVRAIDWVIADAARSGRPAVVSMSLSLSDRPAALVAAMGRLEQAHLTAVVAAGNNSGNACRHAPGSVPTAVTVGASTRNDRRASLSNQGRCVDLFAPGADVRSVLPDGGVLDYRSAATSWATPYVSGAAALFLSAHPSAPAPAVRRWLVRRATSQVLTGISPITPNRLLYAFARL